jgi:hypothetical protein
MESILNDYIGKSRRPEESADQEASKKSEESEEFEEEGIKEAVPKVFDYRERFKKRQLGSSDVSTVARIPRIKDLDGEMDQINGIIGKKAFFGPGTEVDF